MLLEQGQTLREAIEGLKRNMVLLAVKESGGNWAAAARSHGMARSNLHHMAARLGLAEKRRAK
jgi:transcriptional regulator with GAF, ATPase, and Fis domain